MSHELEIAKNGEANMAFVGETPWHGLGKRVPNDVSPEQMLKAANLDWSVSKKQLFFNSEGGLVPTKAQALVRSTDNKVLTVVSDNWNPVQNLEAFEFFNDFVHAGDMEMHTAGSLKGGKMVWAMAQIKDSFTLFGGDKVEGYLLFSNPHEFGRSIDVRFTPVRVVCNNTLSLSLDQEAQRSVRVGHRVEFNANEVKKALGIASDKLKTYKEMAEFLGSRPFSVENMLNYYNEVFPLTSGSNEDEVIYETLSGQAKNCVDNLQTQPGAEYAEGSWWQVFNAATYVTDHIHGRNADNRLHSQWYGQNQLRKIKAAEKAVEYANAA